MAQRTDLVSDRLADGGVARFDVDPAPVRAAFDAAGILAAINGATSRMVTHLDVSVDDIDTVVKTVATALG